MNVQTQQDIDKATKHNRHTLLSSVLNSWNQLCLMIYPVFILLPRNFCRLKFYPMSLPEDAAALAREGMCIALNHCH